MLPPGVNFINIAWLFSHKRQKKLLVFEDKFHHAFSYKKNSGCAICKLRLAVLVALRKSQLAMHKKASKVLRIKMLMKLTPGGRKLQLIYPNCGT
jgi:hypothetical protein